MRRTSDEPEIWKDIPIVGLEGRYQVSSHGRVKNKRTGRILKTKSTPVEQITLYIKPNGTWRCRVYTISQLVGAAFIGPIPDGYRYHHKNGIYTDHHPQNIGITTLYDDWVNRTVKPKRKHVARINRKGEIVEVFNSIHEAERRVWITRSSIRDRCNGFYWRNGKKCRFKSVFAIDGYAYAWDNEESIRRTLLRMREELKDEAIIVDTSGYSDEIEPDEQDFAAPNKWFEV